MNNGSCLPKTFLAEWEQLRTRPPKLGAIRNLSGRLRRGKTAISASDEVPASVSIKDGRNEPYSYGIGLGEAITRS
jgi:hypothetical protein